MFDGLKDWVPANQIDELKELFISTPPPPLFKTSSAFNQPQQPLYDTFPINDRSDKKPWIIVALVGIITIVIAIFYFTSNRSEAAVIDTTNQPSQTVTDSVTGAIEDADKKRLEELEEKERKRQAENEVLTKRYIEYRNNWRKYVDFKTNHYRVDSWVVFMI